MKAEYMDARPPHDRDAVVTYTRVSARRRPKRSAVRAPVDDMAPELTLDGAEVHAVEPDEPAVFDFRADDRRRGRDDLMHGFAEDARRPDWVRYGLVGASLAVIAGVGILAATVGVATKLPGSAFEGDGPGDPVLALNSLDVGAGPTPTTGSIREIPIQSGAPEAARRTEVAPPIPRPRPDDLLASAAPQPDAPAQSSVSVPQPVGAVALPPASSNTAVVPSASVAAAPENNDTDNLIISIEKTLARVDAKASAAPPQTLSPQAQPPATEPPMATAQPVHPPPADIAPSPGNGGIDPVYDVTPPATVDGDQGYSTGPVPPEPVPDLYPQAPQLNPETSGFYPSTPYAFPQETIESTEVRRPGFVRRTLAKATDAVGRVFARD